MIDLELLQSTSNLSGSYSISAYDYPTANILSVNMHISLRQFLASLFILTISSSVALALPTRTQLGLPSLWRRATKSSKFTRAEFQTYALSAMNALNKAYYHADKGLWGTVDNGNFNGNWWPSANILTMFANYYEKYPTTVPWMANLFDEVLTRAPASAFKGFINDFYDDELWWVLAWIQVYDVTGNTKYLDTAAAIYEDAKSVYGNTPCGGLW